MTSVAVVAHAGKSLGGGLAELRRVLADAGVSDPMWFEVAKSKYAPKCVRARSTTAPTSCSCGAATAWSSAASTRSATRPVPLAILPAGTGNLLARNLGIPIDLQAAVDVALHGARRTIDVGRVNGERFAVMAGTGLDALMIRDADRALKDRFGRAAYVWTGAKHLRLRRSGPRSTSTAPAGSTARPDACSSGTWARCSAASRCSTTPAPMTVGSSSASSPPRGSPSGRARSSAPRPAAPTGRSSCAPRRRGRSGSSSTARCRTSSTAATRSRSTG